VCACKPSHLDGDGGRKPSDVGAGSQPCSMFCLPGDVCHPGLIQQLLRFLAWLSLFQYQVNSATGSATACSGIAGLGSVGQVIACVDEIRPVSSEDQVRLLHKGLDNLRETRDSCTAAVDQTTAWGCKGLSDLAYEMFAEAIALLHVCLDGSSEGCQQRGQAAAQMQLSVWEQTADRYRNTPAEMMVTNRLSSMTHDLLAPLADDGQRDSIAKDLPAAWHVGLRAVDKFKFWVSGYIWRETHWLWLMDSLAAGQVVHTTWGEPDEWLKFGVHDAHKNSPLSAPPPSYKFSNRLGMRWEIMTSLLHELHEHRMKSGMQREMLLVVEIGVFAGHLSQHLLRDCDFIQLLGIDPYIGRDGTFPGNFSKTLDADVALYKAASVMEPYGARAQLWPLTSDKAALEIEDGTVDAIFVDGCHLYDCVRSDLENWLPKMRRGLKVLVAGHDFSPQWPGVVQAVHEERRGREVNLASDWMYWWFEQYN